MFVFVLLALTSIGGWHKAAVREVEKPVTQGPKKIICNFVSEKLRMRETKNLSIDAGSRTDTFLERLRDLSLKKKNNNKKK